MAGPATHLLSHSRVTDVLQVAVVGRHHHLNHLAGDLLVRICVAHVVNLRPASPRRWALRGSTRCGRLRDSPGGRGRCGSDRSGSRSRRRASSGSARRGSTRRRRSNVAVQAALALSLCRRRRSGRRWRLSEAGDERLHERLHLLPRPRFRQHLEVLRRRCRSSSRTSCPWSRGLPLRGTGGRLPLCRRRLTMHDRAHGGRHHHRREKREHS
jgi:hypothetical protein